MQRIPYGAALAVVGAVALWSCGGGGTSTPTSPTTSAPPPAPAGPTTVTVSIVSSTGNTAFSPNPIKANSGDTVMFRNTDKQAHHIVIDSGPDLQEVTPGAQSRGYTLGNGAEVRFHCTLHSSMVGSINGAAAPESPPCLDPYGYGC